MKHFDERLCDVGRTIQAIGGKWKAIIIYHLLDGTIRFGELQRRIPTITQRMLTLQLRELEQRGLIVRTVYAEVPPRVEYSLTPLGKTLKPLIQSMKAWGKSVR